MTTFWKTDDFDYHLPVELIAQHPSAQRSECRLLLLERSSGKIIHLNFNELTNFMDNRDLVIFNDTKVIPARLLGCKLETGGRVEGLVERILPEQKLLVHLRASKPPQVGTRIRWAEAFDTRVLVQHGEGVYELQLEESACSVLELLYRYGAIPLPPYIQRLPTEQDQERYQTVFARQVGAVAAPTAGLHFDEALLSQVQLQGVSLAYVTLHVGAGTFQPVRVEEVSHHRMHAEVMEMTATTCEAIQYCRARGGRVITVGTTVARCLESAVRQGKIQPFYGETNLFIYPGYQFQCVDALVTNFHSPRSSLLMLVSALGGYELVRKAYREAVQQRYRFLSYGDAMMVI
ncbi:MAG: tRNA preQ1(34) S-adenosylmethionine ribosyltransferase-isomerase QueA [Coxiella sp. RIFCSPHIGHO2_12_FULL_44_14]|nr:MAG: tRNA preQ1(34) S-adenosylmethionine ribosyltransferase-isomerase QueA [Coxiella sp. RIFCSPHIGHO2_12_FULL_44_14]